MTLRLFVQVAGNQARKLMSYRTDFWIRAVAAFFVEFGLAYFLWTSIYRSNGVTEIAGMTLNAMLLYYITVLLLAKIVRGQERDLTICTEIYDGTLNRYLLYPSNYFGFKYAEHLGLMAPALVELVLFGVVAIAFVQPAAGHAVTLKSIAMAVVSLAIANILHFLLLFPIQAISFWADNVWALLVMFRFAAQMLGGTLLPLNLFPDWSQRILDVLPFKYLFYMPAVTVLGQIDDGAWLRGVVISLGWCAIAALIGRIVWRRGTLQYSGVGI